MIRSCYLALKHLVYAAASLLLLACLAEIGLRVYDSATAQITRRDLYDRGLVCKSWFTHHSLKPSRSFVTRHPDSGERVRVAVNSLGCRGTEYEIPKPEGVVRVVCLGDDTTLAATIPEEETFCFQLGLLLSNRLNKTVEVINAGVPDYCPLLSYLQFRHSLMALEPDFVILNFDPTDVADDYQVRRLAILSREGAPLSCAHPALDLPRQGQPGRDNALLLPQLARQKINQFLAEKTLTEKCRSIESPRCRYMWLDDSPPDWSAYIDQSFSPLQHLDELVDSLGGRLLVAACPAPWQVSPHASTGPGVRSQAGVGQDAWLQSRRPFDLLAQYCHSRQIPFCDVTESFIRDNQPELLFLTNSAALSTSGHEQYAHVLTEFVLPHAAGAATEQKPSAQETRPPPLAGATRSRQ